MNPETPATGGAKRRGVLLVGAVFLLGVVCGAATVLIGARVARGPFLGPPMPRGGIERLARELDLDPDQQARVREILDRHRDDLEHLHMRVGDELREVLNESQRARFDEIRRHYGPPGPGGPRPRHGRPGI